jgi:hypothetical protein
MPDGTIQQGGQWRNFNGTIQHDQIEIQVIKQEQIRRLAYASKLAARDPQTVAKNAEVQAEYAAQQLAPELLAAYPESGAGAGGIGENAISLNDTQPVYKVHYHPPGNKLGIKTLFVHIDTELAKPENGITIPCYDQPACRRPITLYQIWRVVQKSPNLVVSEARQPVVTARAKFVQVWNVIQSKMKKPYEDKRVALRAEQIAQLKAELQANSPYEKMLARFNMYLGTDATGMNTMFSQLTVKPLSQANPETRVVDPLTGVALNDVPPIRPSFCPNCAGYKNMLRHGPGECMYTISLYEDGHRCVGQFDRKPIFLDVPHEGRPGRAVPEMCEHCSGPTTNPDVINPVTGAPVPAGHKHREILADGTLGGESDIQVAFASAQGFCGLPGRKQEACIGHGGGGYLERTARVLAYRDYASRKIRENPQRFELKFSEMVVEANKYAYIIRRHLHPGPVPLTPAQTQVVQRAAAANRDVRWGEEILPPRPANAAEAPPQARGAWADFRPSAGNTARPANAARAAQARGPDLANFIAGLRGQERGSNTGLAIRVLITVNGVGDIPPTPPADFDRLINQLVEAGLNRPGIEEHLMHQYNIEEGDFEERVRVIEEAGGVFERL